MMAATAGDLRLRVFLAFRVFALVFLFAEAFLFVLLFLVVFLEEALRAFVLRTLRRVFVFL